jgi:hypothetical protein
MSSYWLLAEPTHEASLAYGAANLGKFNAYLKHALLFQPELMLSDSTVVNSPNFRRTIQGDSDLLEMLADGALSIARRRDDGKLMPLIEVRGSLVAGSGMNPGFDDRKVFYCNSDLDVLEDSRITKKYDLSDLSSYYTTSIQALLEDGTFTEQLGMDRDPICDAIRTRIRDEGRLDQRFFCRDEPGHLSDMVGPDVWDRCKAVVRSFDNAYYRSGIPLRLGADIVFSENDMELRRILRRNSTIAPEGPVRLDLARDTKTLYEAVLTAAPARKLARLRKTDEFAAFQKSLAALQTIDDVFAPTLQSYIQAAYESLEAYHHVIDDELRILRFFTTGTCFLDRFILRGFARTGGWVLRMGPSLADFVPPTIAALFLKHEYAAGAISCYGFLRALPAIKEKAENLELTSKADAASLDALAGNIDASAKRVQGTIEVAPRSFKDTLY